MLLRHMHPQLEIFWSVEMRCFTAVDIPPQGVSHMSQHDLQELIRLVAAGRRDAADKLAELLHPLLSKPEDQPKTTKRKVVAE